MPIEILMPALSPTMTEGTLTKWLKKEGDKIVSGEVIAEIETDKATMEVEAVDEGILGKIMVAEGAENVPVNRLIALLLEEGEDAAALANVAVPKSSEWRVPGCEEVAKPTPAAETRNPQPATQDSGKTRVFASPLARRIAANEGMNIGAIQGTGPHGRILKADVEDARVKGVGGATAAASFGRNPVEYAEIPNSGMRKTIAKRLVESKQTVPHFYLTVDCELDALLAARTRINDAAPLAGEKPACKLSVNDIIVKAVAMGLREVPAANASWTDSAIRRFNNVDVSVAVAMEDGLITPIVKNADQKPLSVISKELKDLIARARAGKLRPEEYQGGGFSVSNLGMYGVKQFNAVINPPQGCILAVGAVEERVAVKGGQFQAVQAMTVTLSCDHRVVDGAAGAQFLTAFKRYIEDPVMMLV